MKKITIVLVLALLFAGVAAAQDSINLGDFPVGNWMDANYGAVWEFSSNNIRILDTTGNVYWDFTEKGIQDFEVKVGPDGIGITFSCAEAGLSGKTYTIMKPLSGESLDLTITRSEFPEYTVKISQQ